MLTTIVTIAMAVVGVAMALTRLLLGPTLDDRILALDNLTTSGIALLVLHGIREGHGLVFEAALLLAMAAFVTTVALCRYLLRGDVIE